LQNYGVPFASHLNFYQDVLYVVNQNSRLYAFNASTGQKLWSFEALSGLVKPSRSSNISINDNKLIFSNDLGDLTVVDLKQQTVLWSINIFSTNRIFNNFFLKISNILIDKNNVYISSNGGDLLNFNIENGDINWSKKISSIQNHVISDKYLFVLTEDGFIIAFNKLDGNILWSLNLAKFSIDKNNKNKDYYGLILASSNLYVASSIGEIYKISANNGKYISHKKIASELSRAPIIVNNKMLILNHSSELIIIN
jgi:outer membrane protein assembly factor BamB